MVQPAAMGSASRIVGRCIEWVNTEFSISLGFSHRRPLIKCISAQLTKSRISEIRPYNNLI